MYQITRGRRKQSYLHDGSPGVKGALGRLRKSMASEEAGTNKYAQRKDAATLVIHFLRACQHGFKATVLNFIRKVRVVQRLVRAHLAANSGRVQLVSQFLDECYTAAALHITLVQADKGRDLRNLTSMDASKIKMQLSNRPRLRIVTELNSSEFHAYLRKYREHLGDVHQVFGSAYRHADAAAEAAIKRKCILDMVFRMRRQHVARLFAMRKLVLKIPAVTVDDVRRFVQGGEDPVGVYLVAAYKEYEDTLLAQQMEKMGVRPPLKQPAIAAGVTAAKVAAAARSGRPPASGGNNVKPKALNIPQPVMCLLHGVIPEDLAFLYIQIADQIVELRHQTRIYARRQTVNRLAAIKMAAGENTVQPASPTTADGLVASRSTTPSKRPDGTRLQPVTPEQSSISGVPKSGTLTLSASVSHRPATPPGRKNMKSLNSPSGRRIMRKL